ncbi:MAG: hypothetical protein OXI34_05695 [Chloroflexota bacterium]|nr:hypothetical protein [Chloroflexota bacterium]MDE2946115.1 hypothetical protein [Chloroflexota bacterium]
MRGIWILCKAALLASVLATSVYAADIVVDQTCSLADAIRAANTDEAVGGCPAGAGADVITLTTNVTLWADLPRVSSNVTLEGNNFWISGASAYRIFYVETKGKLSIAGLTLRGGTAGSESAPDYEHEHGGAIYSEGELSIEDCTLLENSAGRGGAIYNRGKLSVSGSEFSGNTASLGGAIHNAGVMRLSATTFSDNSAEHDGGGIANYADLQVSDSHWSGNSADEGGAIDNRGALSVSASNFADNSAYYEGGAIYNREKLSVRGSEFSSNTASLGGAIHNEIDLNIDGSTFADNAAYIGGGINNLGELNVSGSTFRGNKAGTGGAINNSAIDSPGRAMLVNSVFTGNVANGAGALSNDGELSLMDSEISRNTALFGAGIANAGTLSISNSTLAANSAEYDDSAASDDEIVSMGGGIFVLGQEDHISNVFLTHVTLARNSADVGGGINIVDSPYAIVSLRNSIAADNSGGDCLGDLRNSAFSLIMDGSCDAEFSGDPMLGDLVIPEDGSPSYFPLLAGSPSIDAAKSDFCSETDQIGTARPQGKACDIGAIEFVSDK